VADADFIVIGAGVVGLSAARALAGAGARTLVIERRMPGAEASSAAAGILAAQAEAAPPLLKLGLMAREHHRRLAPALETETGLAVDYAARGLLELAFDEEGERRLLERGEWQRDQGLSADVLGADEVRDAEPNVSPAVRRGLFIKDDHSVDNVRLTKALAASAVSRGATLLTGRPVTDLVVERGRVAGVRAGNETHHAPVVINAMGAWAGLLGGDPLPPPVEPVRGQMISFDLSPPPIRHVVYWGHGYLVPRADGRLLAGSTTEQAGFDKSVTAAGLRAVLDVALQIAPMLADVRVADAWAGLRPGTPDGLPVIGPATLPGLYLAGGLYRNGILLGPLVGELVAELARGRTPAADLAAFTPMRFHSS